MNGSKNNPDNYKTLKISIKAIIKYLEMLRFVTDYCKIKTMDINAVKMFQFVVKYVPDWYKTNKNKVIINHGRMLEFIPDHYKDLKLC